MQQIQRSSVRIILGYIDSCVGLLDVIKRVDWTEPEELLSAMWYVTPNELVDMSDIVIMVHQSAKDFLCCHDFHGC
jgi:hypothetical protein